MMAEMFQHEDLRKILNNKFIVIIGDSVQRGVYKDMVCLLESKTNRFLNKWQLYQKGESSHCNDYRVEWSGKTRGKWYREVRQYQTDHHLVRYYFVTRCYSDYMETILLDLGKKPSPDVVLMNSCLWDLSRYGPTGMEEYKKNLQMIFRRMEQVLPRSCQFIWLTSMPVATKITAPFIMPDIAFLDDILTIQVKEGNFYASQAAKEYEVDIIDLSWYFKEQIRHRENDGVHWNFIAHRRITNQIMTHLSKSWGILMPSHFSKQVPCMVSNLVVQRRTHQRSNSMPDQFVPSKMLYMSSNNNHLPDKNYNSNYQGSNNNRHYDGGKRSTQAQYVYNTNNYCNNQQQNYRDSNYYKNSGSDALMQQIEITGNVINRAIHGMNEYSQSFGCNPERNYWPQTDSKGPIRGAFSRVVDRAQPECSIDYNNINMSNNNTEFYHNDF